MSKAVVSLVRSTSQAEGVVADLKESGFFMSDISVVFPNTIRTRDSAHANDTKAAEGGAAGIGLGGIFGGTLGLLAGIGALAIPGLGPFIAAGPIVAALSGAAAGAAVGGIAGVLIGLGIPEFEAKEYEGKVRGGYVLIAVHTIDSEMRKAAERILKHHGAEDVSSVQESAAPRTALA